MPNTLDTRLHTSSEQAQSPVQHSPYRRWLSPGGSPWLDFYRDKPGFLLRFPGKADYRLSSSGQDVVCTPVPGVDRRTLEHLYRNQVYPLALSHQGVLVLHASALNVNGTGVALLGESGQGKSTLAGSFAVDGYLMIADDGLVLLPHERELLLQPGPPSLRVWEDSRSALFGADSEAEADLAYTQKLRVQAGEQLHFETGLLPLRRIYLLGNDGSESPHVSVLQGSEALAELVRHAYLLDTQAPQALASQLRELSSVLLAIEFYRLDYPRDYSRLAEVKDLILSQC